MCFFFPGFTIHYQKQTKWKKNLWFIKLQKGRKICSPYSFSQNSRIQSVNTVLTKQQTCLTNCSLFSTFQCFTCFSFLIILQFFSILYMQRYTKLRGGAMLCKFHLPPSISISIPFYVSVLRILYISFSVY